MKRKSSHDSLTGKELAEIILRLIERDLYVAVGCIEFDLVNKIEQICQDVVDEW